MVELLEGRVSNTLKSVANNVVNKYNYYTGKTDTKYNFNRTASSSDIKKTPISKWSNSLDYTSKKDPNAGVLQVKFSSTKVPSDLAELVAPGGELYTYVSAYDPDSKMVTMELPIEEQVEEAVYYDDDLNPYESDSRFEKIKSKSVLDSDGFTTDYTMYKDTVKGDYIFIFGDNEVYEPSRYAADWFADTEDEANEWFDAYNGYEDYFSEGLQSDESVMTPTPIPYHNKRNRRDKDGKVVINEEEILDETPGLTMSSPEVVNGSLEIEINGKVYKYVLNDTTHHSVEDIANTVNKMQKYSDGKALAYLKKNMVAVKESLDENLSDDQKSKLEGELRDKLKEVLKSEKFGFADEDIADYVVFKFDGNYVDREGATGTRVEIRAELSYDGMTQLAEKLDEVIVKYDKRAYFEQVEPGIMEAYIWDDDLVSESLQVESNTKDSKVSFKDHHICNGCGNPLSSCTCEVKEDFSGATQPSSVGQHKTDSIDLISKESEE